VVVTTAAEAVATSVVVDTVVAVDTITTVDIALTVDGIAAGDGLEAGDHIGGTLVITFQLLFGYLMFQEATINVQPLMKIQMPTLRLDLV
jgi:hypothetical protein